MVRDDRVALEAPVIQARVRPQELADPEEREIVPAELASLDEASLLPPSR